VREVSLEALRDTERGAVGTEAGMEETMGVGVVERPAEFHAHARA